MSNPEKLRNKVLDRLSQVRDPGTFIHVVSMRLIRNLEVEEGGHISLNLKPTSNICPLVAKLAVDIKTAIESVEGVNSVDVTIIDHANAETLNQLLKG